MKNLIRRLVQLSRHRAIVRLPSRTYIQDRLIPAIAADGRQRMLFVGVQSYNQSLYGSCEAAGIGVWTVDYNPASRPYGSPRGHIVGDIRKIDRLTDGQTFDVIFFNGVLGFGINTATDALASADAMAKIAEPGAVIIVGWNPGRTDGADATAIRSRLTPATLPGIAREIEFPAQGRAQRNPHRYEIFTFGGTV